MAHDGLQVINDGSFPDLNIPPSAIAGTEDMISINQQYYMGYIGGQLCMTWTS